jgi:predicted hydrocarbon binding protein
VLLKQALDRTPIPRTMTKKGNVMKGVIFNLLESFVIDSFGEEKYEDILYGTDLKTSDPFVDAGMYPDEDFLALVKTTCDKLGITVDQGCRAFGRYCFPKLVGLYPVFLDGISDARSFIKIVDGVIHVEVLKLYSDAELPSFKFEKSSPKTLNMKYTSSKKLCQFMQGIIEGCADFFNEEVKIRQSACYNTGHDHCMLHLEFSPKATGA